MTTIAFPFSRIFRASEFEWGLQDNVFATRSPLNKQVQTLAIPGAIWTAMLSLPNAKYRERATTDALIVSLRGGANRLSLWHVGRHAPYGTMRGSPTLTSAVAAGATVLPVTTTVGATLLAGDMIGVGSQLFMVMADSVATAGTMNVTVAPEVRIAFSSGASVVWDRPTALFILTGSVKTKFVPGYSPAVTLNLEESFS